MQITSSERNSRDGSIDVYRGICMLLVILGHSIGYITDPVNRYIISFHMPIFLFISGMCVSLSVKQRSISENIVHKLKSIGFQYLAFSLIGLLIYWLLLSRIGRDNGISVGESLLGILTSRSVVNGFWFVYDLLVISVLYIFMQRDKMRPFTFFLASFAGFVVFEPLQSYGLPKEIIRILGGAIFFSLGDMFGLFVLPALKMLICKERIRFVLYGLVLLIIVGLVALTNSPVLMYSANFGNKWMFIFGAILASFAFSIISKIIGRSKYLEYIGRNSICFLFFQFYALDATHMLFNVIWGNGLNNTFPYYMVHFISATGLCYVFAFFYNSYLPFLKSYENLHNVWRRKI